MTNLKLLLYQWFNKLYNNHFSVYRPLYFFYKKISDHSKINYLKTHLKPGMTVLDIGANIGFYSLQFSRLVGPNGQVHAFEPDPKNFHHLRLLTASLSNVKINQLAVGKNNCSLKLHLSNRLNVDHQVYDIGDNRSTIMVKSISIDKYLNSKLVDFIKIDIQGYDHQALLGAINTLKQSRPLIILGEFYPFGLVKAGSSAKQYLDFLKRQSFQVKFLPQQSRRKINHQSANPNFYCDFIAVKA